MSKILITCEKPDAAKNIAEILGVSKKINNAYFENEQYIITWAFGHMVKWKDPDEINPSYKEWSLEPLPFKFDINKDMKIDKDKSKQLGIIRTLINRADVSYIINAGDADREGLLIQEEMYRFASNKKPIKVLWSQSLTDKEIIKCMNNLKNNDDFVPLLNAAKARSIIDYMFGISYTRAIAKTIAPNIRISYGRCQTPLLKLLSDREKEIKNFKVEDYYEIKASFDKYYGVLVNENNESIKYKDINEATKVKNIIKNNGKVIDYKTENKKRSAPPLFSLQSLQKEMGNKYHFTADKTLEIAQSLYEKKLTSYPRTDTEYINDEVYNEVEDRIKSAIKLLKIDEKELYINNLKKVVKPNKVSGHHALLPTEHIPSTEKLKSLSENELRVYEAICKRFLAIMMKDYVYESITIKTESSNLMFLTKGTKTIDLGYQKLYVSEKVEKDEENDDIQELSQVKVGDIVKLKGSEILSKKTKAPARYTSASIIDLMEKYTIGRPATQAEIIKRLITMEFIEFKKNKYFVLEKGLNYIDILPNVLIDPNLTKNIEEKLTKIANNEYNMNSLIEDTYNEQVKIISDLKSASKSVQMSISTFQKETNYKCPCCSGNIENRKFSYMCNSCGFTLNKVFAGKELSETTIKSLFSKGFTSLIKGFKSSKTGKKFDASLKINKTSKKVEFVFNSK